MPTEIVFENAALAEVVKRADKVTPKKGEAFDKASGIVFDINPGAEWGTRVLATNLSTYYMEWVNHIEVSGDPVRWRVNSIMLVSIITKLPIGTGATVKFSQLGNILLIQSGRFKAKLGLISDEYYPIWEPFDPGQTAPVKDLGSRIEQAAWAVAKTGSGEAISGLRFDGKTIAATDRYRLVSVPCEAPHITKSTVVPASILGPLVRQMGDTNVGIIGNHMVFMPNEYTQIKCSIYEAKYPNVERVMAVDHTESIKVDRTSFIEAIARVSTLAVGRIPKLQLYIGNEEVVFHMEDEDGRDKTQDSIALDGQAIHDRIEISITPTSLTEAMTASPNSSIEIFYDVSNPRKIIRIDGGSGYQAWVVPRSPSHQGEN